MYAFKSYKTKFVFNKDLIFGFLQKKGCVSTRKILALCYLSSFSSKFQIKTKSKMSVAKRLGLLKASTSALFLCDMQVKFAPSIAYFPEIVKNSKRVLGAAQIFDLPVLATEQYPKGMEYLPIYVHT